MDFNRGVKHRGEFTTAEPIGQLPPLPLVQRRKRISTVVSRHEGP
jgi:hypothetical protein